jgi:hypothetical protein
MWLALTRAKHICNKHFSGHRFRTCFRNKDFQSKSRIFSPDSRPYDALKKIQPRWLRVKNLNPRTG